MFKETIDCIDAGSEFCPCHLAESGECILCSQLQGSHFCDCLNWKGVFIKNFIIMVIKLRSKEKLILARYVKKCCVKMMFF